MEPWELEAVEYGGAMGAEYLESIGIFDLTKLSKDQWLTFLECVCKNYVQKEAYFRPPF